MPKAVGLHGTVAAVTQQGAGSQVKVYLQTQSEQYHVSSLAEICLDWGQSFEMEIDSNESQQHGEDTLEDCKGNAGGRKIFSQDPSEIN
ncbi:hypothetical protein HGM15179_000149 [Zosterops borbonicus]|uniref:Uncharacterized protein n=1 Tax=Zosterops borbonicus TaxID=364589 RepID=A0A8K1GX49_9PASS|nr:hypothetical protein HGM15179_000149 [Zosterops borbonicus]